MNIGEMCCLNNEWGKGNFGMIFLFVALCNVRRLAREYRIENSIEIIRTMWHYDENVSRSAMRSAIFG